MQFQHTDPQKPAQETHMTQTHVQTLDEVVDAWMSTTGGEDQDVLFERLGTRFPGADLNAAIMRAVAKSDACADEMLEHAGY